ncbi:Gypsy retrotransposon integrase-like protein 1 [Branchiostoma belcheri]|nr:Gypsy retrotransposon integrase-like protein 1 [Branchiostoma belcheri]
MGFKHDKQRPERPSIVPDVLAAVLRGIPAATSARKAQQVRASLGNMCPLAAAKGKYPEGYSKKQKRTLRQRAQDFFLDHGVLYYRGSRGKTGQPRQVIGEKDVQKRVIKQCHEGGDGLAHFGRDKTRQKLEARFYWAGMYQDLITTLPSQNPLGRLKKCKLADVDSDSPLFVDALGDQGMWGTQALPTVLNLPLSVIGPAEFTVNRCQDPPMQTLIRGEQID